MIVGVLGEEGVSLLDEVGAGGGVLEEVGDAKVVIAIDGIEVVYKGEDFGVFVGVGDGAGDFVLAIDAVDSASVNDGERPVVDAVAGEIAIGCDDVEPLWKEEVDLLDVFAEGGVAGGIPLDVKGGAEAFAGVEGDVGWGAVGLAVRARGEA